MTSTMNFDEPAREPKEVPTAERFALARVEYLLGALLSDKYGGMEVLSVIESAHLAAVFGLGGTPYPEEPPKPEQRARKDRDRAFVVYGPQGCGKSNNAEKIRDGLGLQRIVDDWFPGHSPLRPSTLHLTSVTREEIPVYNCNFEVVVLPFEVVEMMGFREFMQALSGTLSGEELPGALRADEPPKPKRVRVVRDLDTLAREIHAENVKVGWWDGWLDDKEARHETAMMLSISELAEAMEGDRKNLMDDHLPHRRMFDVELADAAIRLLDLAGAYEMGLGRVGRLSETFRADIAERTPPEQLFYVIASSVEFDPGGNDVETQVETMLAGVLGTAADLDLFPIIAEKRAFNAQRADHKRENRVAANGKAY